MVRRIPVVATATVLLALAGCGDDDGDTTKAENPGADLDRYCRLTQQIDRAGEQFFGRLEGRDPGSEEVQEAQRSFLEQNEERIDEIVRVAPGEIQGDVKTFVGGLRAGAGLNDPDVPAREVGAAEDRLNEFAEENCQS